MSLTNFQWMSETRPFVTSSLSKSPSLRCSRCLKQIADKQILKVKGSTWHLTCLRCSVCAISLEHQTSCFIRNTKIFCRTHYDSIFGIKCGRCAHPVSPNDWIRRAGKDIYHLACFSCFFCKRQLSTGEEFGLMENQILCHLHYNITVLNIQIYNNGELFPLEGVFPGEYLSKTSKRPRTSFTSDQLQIMQAHFTQNKNPDSQTLQKLAGMTGLSRRVIQVWFQNCRARQKRAPLLKDMQNATESRALQYISTRSDYQRFVSTGRT